MDPYDLLVTVVRVDAGPRPLTASIDGEAFEMPPWAHDELDEQVQTGVPALRSYAIQLPDTLLRRIASSPAAHDENSLLRLNITSDDPQLLDFPWELAKVGFGREPSTGGELPIGGHKRVSLVRTPSVAGTPYPAAPPPGGDASPSAVLVVCLPENGKSLPFTTLDGGTGHLNPVDDADAMVTQVHNTLLEAKFDVHVCRDASLESLSATLTQPASVICYLGHGEPDGPILYRDGALRVEPAADFAAVLGRSRVDLVLLLSCYSSSDETRNAGSSLAQQLVRNRVRLAIGMHTQLPRDAAVAFARTFLSRWAGGTPFDEALLDGRQAMSRTSASASRFVPAAFTSLSPTELGHLRRVPRFHAPRFTMTVLPNPADLRKGPPETVVDRRLDTFVVLRREGFAEILVDDPGSPDSLVNDLNAAEGVLERRLPGRTRWWFDLAEGRADRTTSLDELRRIPVDPTGWTNAVGGAGHGIGLVLRRHVADGETVGDVGPERTTVQRLGLLLPGAAVVVRVTADRRLDALAFGAELARALDVGRLLVRPQSRTGRHWVTAPRPLAALVAAMTDQLEDHGFDWLPDEFAADGDPSLPKPSRVVADLNEHEPPHEAEVCFLRTVRTLFPRYYRDLLVAHAKKRAPIWAGMVAAADVDEDLAAWWHAADDRVSLDEVPGPHISPGFGEAVLVLLLSERKSSAVVERWVRRGGTTARRVFAMARGHEGGWEIDLAAAVRSLGPEAELAARIVARLDAPLRDPGPLTPKAPFFWALAGRTALTDLLDVVDDRAMARVLPVLEPLPTANLETRAELEQLRDALWATGQRRPT